MHPLVLKIDKRSESLDGDKSPPIDFHLNNMNHLMTDKNSNDFSF